MRIKIHAIIYLMHIIIRILIRIIMLDILENILYTGNRNRFIKIRIIIRIKIKMEEKSWQDQKAPPQPRYD